MNILVTEPGYFPEEAINIMREVGSVRVGKLSREQLMEAVKNVDVLVIRVDSEIDREVLDSAHRLKLIASATTGLNHIDVEHAESKGVKIVSLHGTHTMPVVEHTFALMLNLCRNVHWAHDSLLKGEWERHKFMGTMLEGKTLGIIGFGRIGRKVAEYAKAFGMKVVASDPFVKQEGAEGVKIVPLEELMGSSDIITIHAALTKETEGMIGHEQFKIAKKGAKLVNTARGKIVDAGALIEALKEGRLSGAALDVFSEGQMKEDDDKLIEYAKDNQNLLLTPHIGASTHESVREASIEIANRIKEWAMSQK